MSNVDISSNQRKKDLYDKLGIIEKSSSSPRILEMHKKGLVCDWQIGIIDPLQTEHIIVGRNPGGNPEKENLDYLYPEDLDMSDYLQDNFLFAKRINIFIEEISKIKNIDKNKVISTFGLTNINYFHSNSTTDKFSYLIETSESLPIFLQEINFPKLKTLIFTGVKEDYFFSAIHDHRTKLENIEKLDTKIKYDWIISFRTKIITGNEITCIFIVHLTGTRGLSNMIIKSIANRINKYI
jgi:hypothetical protein